MDMVNKLMTFIMSSVTQFMGWINGFFKAVVPGGKDTEGKAKFVKYGFILVLAIVAAKVFKFNLNLGGGRGKH